MITVQGLKHIRLLKKKVKFLLKRFQVSDLAWSGRKSLMDSIFCQTKCMLIMESKGI
jgi:hypothetical protein